jgi:hypothetical protein
MAWSAQMLRVSVEIGCRGRLVIGVPRMVPWIGRERARTTGLFLHKVALDEQPIKPDRAEHGDDIFHRVGAEPSP